MNETVEILFNALMDNDAFSTPEIEAAWSNIIGYVGGEYQLQNTASNEIWELWRQASIQAFQLGLKAAVDIQQTAEQLHLCQH